MFNEKGLTGKAKDIKNFKMTSTEQLAEQRKDSLIASSKDLADEDEELLEALSKIDSEQVKNIIIGYIQGIKKPLVEEIERLKESKGIYHQQAAESLGRITELEAENKQLKETIKTLSNNSTMRMIKKGMRDLSKGRIKPFNSLRDLDKKVKK